VWFFGDYHVMILSMNKLSKSFGYLLVLISVLGIWLVIWRLVSDFVGGKMDWIEPVGIFHIILGIFSLAVLPLGIFYIKKGKDLSLSPNIGTALQFHIITVCLFIVGSFPFFSCLRIIPRMNGCVGDMGGLLYFLLFLLSVFISIFTYFIGLVAIKRSL
jgi:hypothetical protein